MFVWLFASGRKVVYFDAASLQTGWTMERETSTSSLGRVTGSEGYLFRMINLLRNEIFCTPLEKDPSFSLNRVQMQ